MPQDTVWIIGAGHLQVPLLEQARSLGLAVLMSDRNPAAPGAVLADAFVHLDTMDLEGHRRVAAQLPAALPRSLDGCRVRGVVTCGADVAPTVAAVAEVLGTPGIPVEVAQRTHHKGRVREALSAAGLDASQPRYRVFDSHEPAAAARHRWPVAVTYTCRAGELGGALPIEGLHAGPQALVVKPFRQCASRGVSIVPPRGPLGAAMQRALAADRRESGLLIEEALTGSEHSAELIRGPAGEVLFTNIVDRVFRYDGGIPLEVGHVNPSRLPPGVQASIVNLLVQAADALGVSWGPFKCDLLVQDGHPYILEATARLSGGWDCQCTTPLSSGRNPMGVVLSLACGLPVRAEDLAWAFPRVRFPACAAILPPPGRLLPWDAGVLAEDNRLIADKLVFHVQPGDVIPPYEHCGTRPGFAICAADTYEDAWCRATTAADRLAAAMITIPEEVADAP